MTETELINWLTKQQSTLDKIISDAGREFHEKNKHLTTFGFDLAECQMESFNLIDGRDLCYDRPNTAFVYSLWYHGRRVNTFLTYFANLIFNYSGPLIEIFDLGAGTGAVQWAIGLVYHKMKESNLRVPNIRLVNIDTSPFMLYYNRDYLWKHFISHYGQCHNFTNEIEYEINSWNNNRNLATTNPWITASYLFDISDTIVDGKTNTEYRDSIKSGFNELIKEFAPSNILLLTSDQPAKRKLLLEFEQEFQKKGFESYHISESNQIFRGLMQETNRFRNELQILYDSDFKRLAPRYASSMRRQTDWWEKRFVGTILTKKQTTLNLISSVSKNRKEIRLYNEPIKVRREIKLNEDQLKAAEHTDRPTIITGPAGCGKSVVITERIKNLIQEKEFSKDLYLLVTTFNKQLLSFLGTWIEDLLNELDSSKFRRIGNQFFFNGSTRPNIILLWFDVLPTRLGNGIRHLDIGYKEYHSSLINSCIVELKNKNSITTNKYDDVLNPDFVLDEYQRIIYGLEVSKKDEYLEIDRTGRPKRLKKGVGGKRELIADLIFNMYLPRLKKESFITKRHRFLQQLKRKEITTKFTYIFVDEFQDCTKADYEIFNHLLIDANNFVLAGDVAQAIQLGSSLSADHNRRVLRIRGREEMRNFQTFILKGSYRLPFRVAEAIQYVNSKPGSDDEADLRNNLKPYKGSPPGARPIIVYASTQNEFKKKIQDIYNGFQVFGIEKISILERDRDIFDMIKAVKISCETETILKLKGLEKTCVLWSTRKDIEYKEEVAEFVYTILSRTSGILIITLSSQTLPKYYSIIDLLDKERLIFWDQETKENFETFCKKKLEVVDVNDDE